MKPREFYNLVVDMSKHQRAFDRSNGRDKQQQRYARELEKRVDPEIARVQLVEKEQLQPRLDLT